MAADERRVGPLSNLGLTRKLVELDRELEEIRSRLDRDNHSKYLSNEARSELVGGMAERSMRRERLTRQLHSRNAQRIIVTGGGNVTVNSGRIVQSVQGPPTTLAGGDVASTRKPRRTASDRRAEFVYGSYEDERKEAKLTFWLSLGVASVAAVFALSAAGVALFHGGDQSTKWVATFVSTAVAVAGGVWHKHARDARSKVSEHVERVEKKVEADDHYEKTNARIDRIQDTQMRDRLNAAATIADLGFQADPNTIADRVIGPSATAPELPSATEPGSERRGPESR